MTISLERTETIETDGTEMAEPTERRDEPAADELFEQLERLPAPEGYKVEIVEGAVYMTPQRGVHWQTIRRIVRALEDHFGMDVLVTSDVRINFPGERNAFAPDVAKIADGAEKNEFGRWRHQDVEFIAEVISQGTAPNDYGPKKTAYALAEVPVYLIADPYTGRCRVFTHPQDGDYKIELTVAYGMPVDLTDTVVGITLATDVFPRD
ncbi:Uma2 family endonuclease [Streptomyces sp. 2333.5]|nr:Uma2 family endonuclease [Streptomyces sp. 2333.5]SEE36929.1 Endonuclease, Uma2 family (restriction endonuclease fold) [Streptomyces sp. 2314.4]SEE63353.1 Endonuclease, Uma2 family (restriction endonuclease fold) [Streptomyces sp. 2112.2]